MGYINQDWDEVLASEFEKPYFKELWENVETEYARGTVYPSKENIFNALSYTPYHNVRVLLLGQDPYHGPGQAHGMAFSVQPGTAFPPSLQNIFKELGQDVGMPYPDTGCLIPWAEQGVLLLNTVLTVRESEPNSHKKLGWTTFTDAIISKLNEREEPVIFLLWGANAREKLPLITGHQHFVLSTVHPSPLSASRGFFGCKHFSKTNTILKRLGQEPIRWEL